MQISWMNGLSQKFMTSNIFRSFYLQTKVYALFNLGWREGKYKDEMIIFNGLQIQIFNAFQISFMNIIDWEQLCNLAVLKYLTKTLKEYLHWLKNSSCSPFYCSRRKFSSFTDMFQGFCLHIKKFEKAIAFYFWKHTPYEMCWFLLIVKKFILSILQAFVGRFFFLEWFNLKIIN